jgi:hypothetical protein
MLPMVFAGGVACFSGAIGLYWLVPSVIFARLPA